jgi:hypothetical protein
MARRRRELRKNELIEFLTEKKDFVVQCWPWVAGGVVAIVLVLGALMYARRAAGLDAVVTAREANDVMPGQRVERLQQVAREYAGDPDVRQTALDAIARDALRSCLMPDTRVDADARKQLLAAADDAARELADDPSATPEIKARAHLILAAIAEDRDQEDQARQQYRAILDNAELSKVVMYASIAAQREATLAERMEPVVFAPPATQPTTKATTQPTTGRTITLTPSVPGQPTVTLTPVPKPTTQPAE